MSDRVLLTGSDIRKIIDDTAAAIVQSQPDLDRLAIVGVQTRGVELANRVRSKIEELSGAEIRHGILDITFYRDDLATRGMLPVIKETRITFNINDITILLVDDVIFTGRTAKAAIDTLISFGRPRAIRLFTLVDRGGRELPIQPDYCGHRIETTVKDKVRVRLMNTDGEEDRVVVGS
jgi:pyrimidine operon attenuation protein/uracil phosphoribosyltransferase